MEQALFYVQKEWRVNWNPRTERTDWRVALDVLIEYFGQLHVDLYGPSMDRIWWLNKVKFSASERLRTVAYIWPFLCSVFYFRANKCRRALCILWRTLTQEPPSGRKGREEMDNTALLFEWKSSWKLLSSGMIQSADSLCKITVLRKLTTALINPRKERAQTHVLQRSL